MITLNLDEARKERLISAWKSTARVSLAEVFNPLVRREGSSWDLDLRVRPAATPAAAGNLGFGPLGIEVEKRGFRTVRLITGRKFP